MKHKFNINNSVKVKLLPSGINELRRQHQELKAVFPGLPSFNINIDEDGYTEFQLWDLMNSLGPLCSLGCTPPFETNIFLDV